MSKHNDMFGTEIQVDDVIVFAHNPHKLVNLYKGKVTNITTRFIIAEYIDEVLKKTSNIVLIPNQCAVIKNVV